MRTSFHNCNLCPRTFHGFLAIDHRSGDATLRPARHRMLLSPEGGRNAKKGNFLTRKGTTRISRPILPGTMDTRIRTFWLFVRCLTIFPFLPFCLSTGRSLLRIPFSPIHRFSPRRWTVPFCSPGLRTRLVSSVYASVCPHSIMHDSVLISLSRRRFNPPLPPLLLFFRSLRNWPFKNYYITFKDPKIGNISSFYLQSFSQTRITYLAFPLLFHQTLAPFVRLERTSLSLSLYRVFPSQFVGVVYRSGVDEWRDAALHAPRKRHSNNTNVPAEPSIAYIMRVVYCRGVEGMLNDICHLYAPTMDRLVPSVSIDRSIDLPPRDPFSRIRVGCCASIHRWEVIRRKRVKLAFNRWKDRVFLVFARAATRMANAKINVLILTHLSRTNTARLLNRSF